MGLAQPYRGSQSMTPDRIKAALVWAALLILFLVLTFGSMFNIDTFRKYIVETHVSSLSLNGVDAVRKIEISLTYGKRLETYAGLSKLLQELKTTTPLASTVQIVLKDGRVAQSISQGSEVNRRLTDKQLRSLALLMVGSEKRSLTLLDGHTYNVFLSIRDSTNANVGAVRIQFDESVITHYLDSLTRTLVAQTIVIGCFAAVILYWVMSRLEFFDPQTGRLNNGRLQFSIFLIVGLAQIALVVGAIIEFRPVYEKSVHRNHELTVDIIKKDLAGVFAKGPSYSDLGNVDTWLGSFTSSMPELDRVALVKSDGTLIASTRPDVFQGSSTSGSPTWLRWLAHHQRVIQLDLDADADGTNSIVLAYLEKNYWLEKVSVILSGSTFLLLTTILFSLEVVLSVLFNAISRNWRFQ